MRSPPGHRLFEHACALAKLLELDLSVRVALSTSWAVRFSYSGAVQRLPRALQERVIGAKFHSQMDRAEFVASARWQQILGDVQRRRPHDWVAIDDDGNGW